MDNNIKESTERIIDLRDASKNPKATPKNTQNWKNYDCILQRGGFNEINLWQKITKNITFS